MSTLAEAICAIQSQYDDCVKADPRVRLIEIELYDIDELPGTMQVLCHMSNGDMLMTHVRDDSGLDHLKRMLTPRRMRLVS